VTPFEDTGSRFPAPASAPASGNVLTKPTSEPRDASGFYNPPDFADSPPGEDDEYGDSRSGGGGRSDGGPGWSHIFGDTDPYNPPDLLGLYSKPGEGEENTWSITQEGVRNLLSQLGKEGLDPKDAAELTNAILTMSNLPSAQFHAGMFPQVFGQVADIANMAKDYATTPYNMPNAPNLDPEGFYKGGQAGADLMNYAIDQIQRTQGPQDNLANLAKEQAEYLETRSGDLVNPYRAELDKQYEERRNELESSLAARGMLGSTQADEALNRLEESRGRAASDADLRFYKGIGQERRADVGVTADLLDRLYGQRMGGAQFGLQQSGALMGGAGQAESMDLARRQGQLGRQQLGFQNQQGNVMMGEDIAKGRLGMMQQPVGMGLSALSGVNVAPPTVSPVQGPRQGPSGWEIAGSIVGGGLPNLWGQ
tara:strand:- start:658 stop:1929 length:1272 start_codon:yes stop_codon:yes gene_type:complete